MNPLDVLVVDGSIVSACIAADVLERRGHRVHVTCTGAQALGSPRPDVLLSALSLADMSGFELLEAFAERGHTPRTIFVAASASPDDYRRALRVGAHELLPNEHDERELLRAVESPGSPRPQGVRGRYARSYPSAESSTDRATRDVLAHALRCGVAPAARARIGGACSEAIENAVRHAYDGSAGTIEVEARMDERQMVVNVRDRGDGFDPAGLDVQGLHRCSAGGFSRMCALAEDVRVDSTSGRGTDVELYFAVHRAHFDSATTLDLTELDFLTPTTSRMVLETLDEGSEHEPFHFSPALAVAIGRLLAGPDPRQVLQTALWS